MFGEYISSSNRLMTTIELAVGGFLVRLLIIRYEFPMGTRIIKCYASHSHLLPISPLSNIHTIHLTPISQLMLRVVFSHIGIPINNV